MSWQQETRWAGRRLKAGCLGCNRELDDEAYTRIIEPTSTRHHREFNIYIFCGDCKRIS